MKFFFFPPGWKLEDFPECISTQQFSFCALLPPATMGPNCLQSILLETLGISSKLHNLLQTIAPVELYNFQLSGRHHWNSENPVWTQS